ncbi:hypothetical protein GCM10011611_51340 [Aliidongia dinghuensis]|uniref:DUF2189 domain-containing protein n=1 Tax=Aliidongia dinghuensis TaxID=1867774 RepID=A0A8J2YZ01_9PROT|nr:DUF2189 domain-containing protein [Aliidongia dinghuensis]GGF38714.1 hypothetical protein GCM10011611_51340 [Aliidongia dinghuensis]
MTIRNPVEWGMSQVKLASDIVEHASHAVYHPTEDLDALRTEIHHITTADLRDAIRLGFEDFKAYRTDVVFLSIIYPILGVVLARAALGTGLIPLLFPLAAGFALVGPFAGVGLYEMSRRREQGISNGWSDAFGVFTSPSWGAIAVLGFLVMMVYIAWLVAAETIYMVTLGPEPPISMTAFVHDMFTTGAGWIMIGVGMGVGFLFAVMVLALGAIAFPLLIDHPVGVDTAIWTSMRAMMANPVPMALWGLTVAVGLFVGSIPAFVGLIVIMPVLGHATWHLYRKLVSH